MFYQKQTKSAIRYFFVADNEQVYYIRFDNMFCEPEIYHTKKLPDNCQRLKKLKLNHHINVKFKFHGNKIKCIQIHKSHNNYCRWKIIYAFCYKHNIFEAISIKMKDYGGIKCAINHELLVKS